MTDQTQHAEQTRKAKPQRQEPVPDRPGPVDEHLDLSALQRAVLSPGKAATGDILGLQRVAGNRAVSHLIQTKLTVGPADDSYEQEADRVAEQVLSIPAPATQPANGGRAQRQVEEEEVQTKPVAAGITRLVQRGPLEEEEIQTKPLIQRGPLEEEEIQTKPLGYRGALVQRGPLEEEEVQTKPLLQRGPLEEDEIQTKPLVQRGPLEEEEIQTKPLVQRGPLEEEEIQTKALVQRGPLEEEEVQTKPLLQRGPLEEEEIQTKPLVQRGPLEEEEIQTKPLVQRGPLEEEEIQTKPLVQRGPLEEEEIQTKALVQRGPLEEEEIQTKPQGDGGFDAGAAVESRLAAGKGSGAPLPGETRSFMESRFGTDFSDVRLHADSEAADLNRSLSAQAFTHGHDIYMPAERFSPGTAAGDRLLAHELTHVVQQTGRVQPQIQRWDLPGHELITAATVREYNRQVEEEGKKKTPPMTDDQIKKAQISKADLAQLKKGAVWNDLLGHSLAGMVLTIGIKGTMTHESHEGALQFLHGMASKVSDEAWQTQRKIMLWAEFCYKVFTGVIKGDETLGSLDWLRADVDFQGAGVSIASLFQKWNSKTVSWLFTEKKDSPLVKQRALGSMLHMLQDTFCASHSQRVAKKGEGQESAGIRGFNVYGEQSASPLSLAHLRSKYKNRHGIADLLKNKSPEETAGAEQAVKLGAKVLGYAQQGADWDSVVKPYMLKVFGLVPELERQAKGNERAGIQEMPSGRRPVSASGRQFRKPRLSNWFASESSVRLSRRPGGLKTIDDALVGYEQRLFEFELDTLSDMKSDEVRAGQLQTEGDWIKIGMDLSKEWSDKNEGSKDKDTQKRNAAVMELRKRLREDWNEVKMDFDSVKDGTGLELSL